MEVSLHLYMQLHAPQRKARDAPAPSYRTTLRRRISTVRFTVTVMVTLTFVFFIQSPTFILDSPSVQIRMKKATVKNQVGAPLVFI